MRRWAPQAAHKPLAPLKGELAAKLSEGSTVKATTEVNRYATSPPTKKHAPAPAGACDPFKLHYSVPVSGSVVAPSGVAPSPDAPSLLVSPVSGGKLVASGGVSSSSSGRRTL